MQNKIKNISFNRGIVRTPGYSQAEGELSECINLIPRNGELVNILPPTKKATGLSRAIMAVHHVSPENRDQYIVRVGSSGLLSYNTSLSNSGNIDFIDTEGEQVYIPYDANITPIGNILCISTSSSLRYFLWKDGTYVDLGDADFSLDIQFGIQSEVKTKYFEPEGADTSRDGKATPTVKVALSAERRPSSDEVWENRSWNVLPVDNVAVFKQDLRASTDYKAGVTREISFADRTWKLRITLYSSTSSGITQVAQYVGNAGITSYTFTTPATPLVNSVTLEVVKDNGGTLTPISYTARTFLTEDIASSSQSSTAQNVYKLMEQGDSVMGLANEIVADAAKDNLFSMPFFARFAIKLTTGQYVYLSEPCFLEPNTIYAPSIRLTPQFNKTTNIGHEGVDCDVEARMFVSSLWFRVNPNGLLEKLKKYEDVIEGIAIAVTPPVYLYDQAANDEALNDSSKCVIKYESNFTGDILESWGVNKNSSRSVVGILYEAANSTNLKLLLPTGGERKASYAMSGSQTNPNDYTTVQVDTAIQQRRINALASWYVVAEIPLRALAEDSWSKVSLKPGALAALYAQDYSIGLESLVDTLTTNLRIIASSGEFSYNNRLFHYGALERIHRDWNPSRMSGFCQDNTSTGYTYEVHFTNNRKYSITGLNTNGGARLGRLRFLAFPDTEAVSGFCNSGYAAMKLDPQGVAEMAVGFWDNWAELPSGDTTRTYPDTLYPNKLYMSYTNQPLALDRNASITFSGEIRALSVVTKALTQGQFGQFPIYVFTSDGIWMLEVGNNGVITSSHPVSRDIITQGTQPLQTDDAIFFITAQGLKKLTGSSITLVSEPVHGFNFPEYTEGTPTSFGIKLPASLADYQALLENADTTDIFESALQTAKLLYDYYQNLVHVFLDYGGHYVFSIDTSQWAQQCILEYNSGDYFRRVVPSKIIPSYPHSLFVADSNDVYSYDGATKTPNLPAAPSRTSAIITKPIAFEDPTTMTALMDFRVIRQQVYEASAGEVGRTAVYASRDGRTWHNLFSLKQGSYKFFRFVIVSHMADIESIQGLTALYQPRRTHKLR